MPTQTIMLTPVVLLAVFCGITVTHATRVCGVVPIRWRNQNYTCPANAVCGDVFSFTRDWQNGTTCDETRTLHNCMCPGGRFCPVHNPLHKLQETRGHTRYTCQPVCDLPFCGNIRRRPGSNPTTALTSKQRAPEFHGLTYQRIDCRCPGHMSEDLSRSRGRSTRSYRQSYNYLTHRYSTIYICKHGYTFPREDTCA